MLLEVRRPPGEIRNTAGQPGRGRGAGDQSVLSGAGDVDAHVRLDQEFHQMIAAGSGNERLASSIEQLRDQTSVLVRVNSGQPAGMNDGVLRAHGPVARSIARHDGDRAEARIREHIRAVLVFMSAAG